MSLLARGMPSSVCFPAFCRRRLTEERPKRRYSTCDLDSTATERASSEGLRGKRDGEIYLAEKLLCPTTESGERETNISKSHCHRQKRATGVCLAFTPCALALAFARC